MNTGGNMVAADTDVLIFVEDPGAANLIIDLPSALSAEGHRGRVLATGDAAPYLRSAGAEFDELELGRKVTEIIEAYAPRLIVVGTSENPETSGLKLVAQARQQGHARTVGSTRTVRFRWLTLDAGTRDETDGSFPRCAHGEVSRCIGTV